MLRFQVCETAGLRLSWCLFSKQKTGKFIVHILCNVYCNLVNNYSQFMKQL